MALGIALLLVGTAATAAWLSLGAGSVVASATSIEKASTPVTTLDGADVSVAWVGSTLASGAPVDSYDVLRHDGAAVTTVCARVASTTCRDTSPSPRAARYAVVARVGTSWVGPASDLSATVVADATTPLSTLALAPAPNSAGYARGAVAAVLSATDTGSGVGRLEWSVDGRASSTPSDSASFTVSGTGAHEIAFHAVDRAGNVEPTRTVVFTIDPDKPTTTVSYTDGSGTRSTPRSWYRGDVRLDFAASDAAGASSLTVDGVLTPGPTATTTVTATGSNEVSYFATDVAGNVEDVKRTTVRIDRHDPVATIDPASSLAWYRVASRSFTLNASDTAGPVDSNSGVASVTYTVDGGAPTTVMATELPFTPATALGQGDHSVTFFATDNAGRVQPTQTARLRVDNGLPTLSPVVSPAANAAGWHSSEVTVTATASDAVSGIASRGVATSADGTYLSSQRVTAEGATTLFLRATDNAGNTSSSTTTVRIDTTKPSVTGVRPVPARYSSGAASWSYAECGSGYVCATVSEAGSGVASVSFVLSNGSNFWNGSGFGSTNAPQTMVPVAGSSTVWRSATTIQLQPGNRSYSVTVTAVDVAGNQGTGTTSFTTR